LVPKAEIAAQGYDLSLSRYKEVEQTEVHHRASADILAELEALEREIAEATSALARALEGSPE
jgi:type I restriction enzyme M protein